LVDRKTFIIFDISKSNKMENVRIISKEEMKNFSADLKDSLCKIYRFIPRNFTNIKEGEELYTELRVQQARRRLSSVGGGNDVKYSKIFIANLELIKELVENQPSMTVEYGYYGIVGDSKEEVYIKHEEITYDSYEINGKYQINKKGYISKIISTKNLPQ
jgi:hypothetical protein